MILSGFVTGSCGGGRGAGGVVVKVHLPRPPPCPRSAMSTPLPNFIFVFSLYELQGLREETRTLEASRDELVAEAAAKLSERTAELKGLRERAADLSSKLEVCFSVFSGNVIFFSVF